jgi:hypothetical protein
MKTDPGPCPICGAAHTACRSDSGPIAIVQLPARDDAAATSDSDAQPTALGDGGDGRPFSTATYRGQKKKA